MKEQMKYYGLSWIYMTRKIRLSLVSDTEFPDSVTSMVNLV